MPWIERCGEVTNLGAVHCFEPEYVKVDSMWPFTSRTLKPTLDQSMLETGGGGKAAMVKALQGGVLLEQEYGQPQS
jgi:hypothetical protein